VLAIMEGVPCMERDFVLDLLKSADDIDHERVIPVLTMVDRAGLAAYCQAYGRWVEAEERLRATPPLVKTPSGYVQQSPWLSIANKQLELMGRYMAEFGMTPASRSRLAATDPRASLATIEVQVVRSIVDGDAARENRPHVLKISEMDDSL
jgi:P27 family predicted phage terminase small subunit